MSLNTVDWLKVPFRMECRTMSPYDPFRRKVHPLGWGASGQRGRIALLRGWPALAGATAPRRVRPARTRAPCQMFLVSSIQRSLSQEHRHARGGHEHAIGGLQVPAAYFTRDLILPVHTSKECRNPQTEVRGYICHCRYDRFAYVSMTRIF